MPPKSRDAFQQAFMSDFKSLISKTCKVDLRNAESYHGGECLKKNSDGVCCEVTSGKILECPNDKARIFQACETAIEGGIEVVSQRVIELMIDWMILSGKEVIERNRRTLGDTHRSTLWSINNMAMFLKERGKSAEAEPLLVEALEGSRRTLGDTHPNTLSSINNMASFLNDRGKYAEAEPLYVEALEGYRSTLGDTHPDTLMSINNMALFLKERGKYVEAEPLYVEALKGYRRTLGDTHQDTFRSMRDYADFLCSRGILSDLPEAATLAKSALLGLQSSLGESHLASLNALRVHGRVLYLQGFLSDSFQILKQALIGLQKENNEESLRYAIRDLTAAENALLKLKT
jgi:tetratricopeptide (TPR) repeat protein